MEAYLSLEMPLLHWGLKFPFRYPSWKLFSTKMTYLEICQELLLCLDDSCFVTRFSNGSPELTLFTDQSLYFGIFNLATTLKKNMLKISEISLLLPMISSFSISVIFCFKGPLSEKKSLTVFQNNLLSVTFLLSRSL